MIVTDLNDRERKRYANEADVLAKAAAALAENLRAGNDDAATVQLVMLSMSGQFVLELAKIFATSVLVSIPDKPDGPPS